MAILGFALRFSMINNFVSFYGFTESYDKMVFTVAYIPTKPSVDYKANLSD